MKRSIDLSNLILLIQRLTDTNMKLGYDYTINANYWKDGFWSDPLQGMWVNYARTHRHEGWISENGELLNYQSSGIRCSIIVDKTHPTECDESGFAVGGYLGSCYKIENVIKEFTEKGLIIFSNHRISSSGGSLYFVQFGDNKGK